MRALLIIPLLLLAGCVSEEVNSFEECVEAGYPVMESHPRQCRAGDTLFVEQIACTADAKLCPDGSAVGRVPPDCEFAPCPEGDMVMDYAYMIGTGSSCADIGSLGAEGFYNDNSETWWFPITLDDAGSHPGCNPHCVVHENSTAEINWMCTGLIIE